jgi:hypothetical protein
MQSARVDELVTKALESPDAGDRAAAVKTLAFRSPTAQSVAILSRLLKGDPAPIVRSTVIRECQQLLRTNREMMLAFEWCAQNDADKAVREAAKRALAALEQRG